ncbi:MAG: hypothetical protein WBL67_09885 [Nitrososphaeraceae archaeon]
MMGDHDFIVGVGAIFIIPIPFRMYITFNKVFDFNSNQVLRIFPQDVKQRPD